MTKKLGRLRRKKGARITAAQRQRMAELRAAGLSAEKIAELLGCDPRTVARGLELRDHDLAFRGAIQAALTAEITVHLASIRRYLDLVVELAQTPGPVACAERIVPLLVRPPPIVEDDVPAASWEQIFPGVVETPEMEQMFAHALEVRTAWRAWREAMKAYVPRVLAALEATQAEAEQRTGLRRTSGFTEREGLAGDAGLAILAHHLRKAAGEETTGGRVEVQADGRSLGRQGRRLGIAPPAAAAHCADVLNELFGGEMPEVQDIRGLWQEARARGDALLRVVREAQALPARPVRTCPACWALANAPPRGRRK